VTVLPLPAPRRIAWRVSRRTLAAVLAVALVVRGVPRAAHDEDATAFRLLGEARDWVDANRNSSPVFLFFLNYVRFGIALLVAVIQIGLNALGWMGLVATAGALALVLAGWRTALLAVAGFASFGLLGLWQDSVDTLALTLAAVVLSLAIGIPLGVAAGRSRRIAALITPVLDVMQIMPTFAYLAPMALLFLIGSPSATVATMIYAIPPAIRITALGIRGVSPSTVEAAVSLGSTRWQLLRKVQLPMAKRTIILALNQTIMMALSMVVITALIDAPGLGQTIVKALERVNVGAAFDAGLAIVVMAIVLDRVTTRASQRVEAEFRSGGTTSKARRRTVLAVAVAGAAVATAAGRALPLGAEFPDRLHVSFAGPVNGLVDWVESTLYPLTDAAKNVVTHGLLNPLQTVLTTSPWWLLVGTVFAVGLLLSGLRAAATAALALVAVLALGLWQHATETLATVLVATVITMLIGTVLGVVAARNVRFAAGLRPLLDAAQTMPSFVYLLPAVALFGATRFTAVVASIIFAVPPVVRLIEDGIRAVPPTVVEAAASAGSTSRQILWKVQLPMARGALLLATNQGIVMVLAMVVVGGLVGAGALGYDVVAGFAQSEDFGKGLAAGIAIVLLGVMLDRLTQGAGRRSEQSQAAHHAG